IVPETKWTRKLGAVKVTFSTWTPAPADPMLDSMILEWSAIICGSLGVIKLAFQRHARSSSRLGPASESCESTAALSVTAMRAATAPCRMAGHTLSSHGGRIGLGQHPDLATMPAP